MALLGLEQLPLAEVCSHSPILGHVLIRPGEAPSRPPVSLSGPLRDTSPASLLRRRQMLPFNAHAAGSPGSVADAVPASTERFESDLLPCIGGDDIPVPQPVPCLRWALSNLPPPAAVGIVLVRAARVVGHMCRGDFQPSDSARPERVAVLLPVQAVGEREVTPFAAGVHAPDRTDRQFQEPRNTQAGELGRVDEAVMYSLDQQTGVPDAGLCP